MVAFWAPFPKTGFRLSYSQPVEDIEQGNYLFDAEGYCNIPQIYLNIVFNGSTSALGAFRVGSNPAIQTKHI